MAVYDVNGNILSTVYGIDGSLLDSAYDVDGNQIHGGTPVIEWLDTAVVTSLPSISVNGVKQGACTDGTYIYQIVFNSLSLDGGFFLKYKISDGTYTTTAFTGTQFGHANDMTYNPNNGHIYVATMESDGSVHELDSGFNIVETHYAIGKSGNAYAVWQFAFDRKTNHFISANGGGMAVYDADFNYLGWFDMPTHPDATAQGMETDGDFIFRLTYNPNYVDVATIAGEYVKTIALPVTGEPEGIMYNWTNGEYYISRYVNSDIFSKIQLKA